LQNSQQQQSSIIIHQSSPSLRLFDELFRERERERETLALWRHVSEQNNRQTASKHIHPKLGKEKMQQQQQQQQRPPDSSGSSSIRTMIWVKTCHKGHYLPW
jgi:hypothetical protein